MATLERLPAELLHEVASYLAFFDRKALSITSKSLHSQSGPLKCPNKSEWIIHLCQSLPTCADHWLILHWDLTQPRASTLVLCVAFCVPTSQPHIYLKNRYSCRTLISHSQNQRQHIFTIVVFTSLPYQPSRQRKVSINRRYHGTMSAGNGAWSSEKAVGTLCGRVGIDQFQETELFLKPLELAIFRLERYMIGFTSRDVGRDCVTKRDQRAREQYLRTADSISKLSVRRKFQSLQSKRHEHNVKYNVAESQNGPRMRTNFDHFLVLGYISHKQMRYPPNCLSLPIPFMRVVSSTSHEWYHA